MNEGQEVILREITTKESSQIEKKLAYVGESINALEESVGELERRLVSVIVASRKEDESKDAVERPAISPLGGQLDAYNLRLQGIRSLVTNTLDRLDL